MEKAWAKIYGSYENIEAGYTREALYALTGAPTKVFYIEDLRDQEAFETVKKHLIILNFIVELSRQK